MKTLDVEPMLAYLDFTEKLEKKAKSVAYQFNRLDLEQRQQIPSRLAVSLFDFQKLLKKQGLIK